MKKITDSIYQISSFGVNVFVYKHGEELILIDTGMQGSIKTISKSLKKIGESLSSIKLIIITHAHIDHSGGLDELLKVCPDAKVYCSEHTMRQLNSGEIDNTLHASPGLLNRAMLTMGKFMAKDKIEVNQKLDNTSIKHLKNISVVDLPGHADGQIGLLVKSEEKVVLIAADSVATMFGLGYMFGYRDFTEAKKSIEKMKQLDFDILLCGHGRPVLENAREKFLDRFQDVNL